MDYKTNISKDKLVANVKMLPEINGLNFCVIGEKTALFDYTAYFEENNIQYIDHKIFMRQNKHFIKCLSDGLKRPTTEMFYQNTDGHIFVAAELAFLFLAFVNQELCVYFNSLLSDVISDGVAYSNGFIYDMAAERLPSDILHSMIKERENDTARSE